MDSSLHVSSHSYASRLRVMEQAQTETQSGKIQKILLLSTIFTSAVGRILINSQLWILSCSSHRDPNNFWPKLVSWIIYCMMHTATMSQHQKALASRMGMSGTHNTFRIHLAADSAWQGTGIEMKECPWATAALITETTFHWMDIGWPDLRVRLQILRAAFKTLDQQAVLKGPASSFRFWF